MSTEFYVTRKDGALKPNSRRDAELMDLLPTGTPLKIKATTHPRNEAHHRKFFGLLGVVSDATDYTVEQLLVMVKIGVGHMDEYIMPLTGEVVMIPRSISWAKMDQAEFSKFYERAERFILERILPGVTSEELAREVREFIAPNQNYTKSEAGGARAAKTHPSAGGGASSGASLPSEAKQLAKVG